MEIFNFIKSISSSTINISLNKTMGLTGISDDTNDFIEHTKLSLINPTTDSEFIRLKYNGNNLNIIPNFKGINQSYNNSLTNALFTDSEQKNRSDNVTNSYFILELYDSLDNNNQTLLSSNKMDIYTKSGYTYNVINDTLVTLPYIYPNKSFLEFSNIYIPNNYVPDIKNVLYIKFRFFNAKLGGVSDFFYSGNTNVMVDTDFYFKLNVDVDNGVYNLFDYKTIVSNYVLNIYENKNVNLTKKNNDDNQQNPLVANKKATNWVVGYGESGN